MTHQVSTAYARENFGTVLDRVSQGEDTVLTRHGRAVAVMISPKAYAELTATEDNRLGALAGQRLEGFDADAGVTLTEILAEEDAADACAYRCVLTAEAARELMVLGAHAALRITHHLLKLQTDPLGFGTTELVSQPGTRRLRVGDYRVTYTIQGRFVVVAAIGVAHRRNA